MSKSAIILVFTLVSLSVGGGLAFYFVTQGAVVARDTNRSLRLTQLVALAAQDAIQTSRREPLVRLLADLVENEPVAFVSVEKSDGAAVAMAFKPGHAGDNGLFPSATQVHWGTDRAGELTRIVRPVVAADAAGNTFNVGSVRLIADGLGTRQMLERLRVRLAATAGLCAICLLPVACLLVWRVVIQPVRRLTRAARRMAAGDMLARAAMRRGDEIGELASAFDVMADRVATAQAALRSANEGLEQTVRQRTSEIEHANERLREAMAESQDFLRAVSHDLSAPLRNIGGMAAMIEMKWRGQLPPDALERLERIRGNVAAQEALIKELLELSRIRTRTERRENVDFGALLTELAQSFDYDLRRRDVALVIRQPMPTLHVERSRFRQVFQNLIDNAIKYMDKPSGGRIEVAHELRDGMHRLVVRDNGPGIAPENHSRVFHVFRRVEGPQTAKVEGKGVGLAVVRSVVGKYDGRAWVESQLGQGAAFFIELPSAAVAPQRHLDAPREQTQPQETVHV
jgi:signal transduction histidine kinase